MDHYLTLTEVSNALGLFKAIVAGWEKTGKLIPKCVGAEKLYFKKDLLEFETYRNLADSNWETEEKITPVRPFRSIELFAGLEG